MKKVTRVLLSSSVLLGLAACGDDEDAGVGSAAGATGGDEVTVEHAFGTTTVEDVPERVVTLGAQWTDVLLAMEVDPVGHVVEEQAGPGGIYPWQEGLLDTSAPLDLADGIPFEQVAALDPDLIVVTYYADEQSVYDQLAAIAPTIPLLGDRHVDPWQELITIAGDVFGRPDRAQQVVDEVDALLAAAAAELPGLAGKTFALANYLPGDSIYVVADPDDGSTVFFEQLGLVLDPEILAAADGATGRIQLSLEQAGLLDSDLLVLLANGGDPHDLVGFDQLPSVRTGGFVELDFATVVGLNTPTPLGVPYALEVVRPALEAAAAG